MVDYIIKIAEHVIGIRTDSAMIQQFIGTKYGMLRLNKEEHTQLDMQLFIEDGYGVPFVNYEVNIVSDKDHIVYTRSDYRIEADREYRQACISVHDEFALKHAMVNVYSAFITRRGWGLLIHSSCLIEGSKAFLFAGHSGAGKSTVARLSMPRPVLSDEATIVKPDADGTRIFNSPFRSDTDMPGLSGSYPLTAMHVLRQSLYNKRTPLGKTDAVLHIVKRIFFWAHDPEETKKVFKMCKVLADRVPVYELYFQKNNTFWEEIS